MENRLDILNELKALSPAVAAIEKINVFTVPEGYFEWLSSDILVGICAENELLNLTTEAPVAEVPVGYFESLAGSVLAKIKAQDVEGAGYDTLPVELSGIRSNHVFEVPEGYFDTLSHSILAKIKAADVEDASTEIKALSPILSSIKNENIFTIPQGYFENLSTEVLNKVVPQAKVVKMPGRSSTFVKYAVAAAFTGMMALSIFKFTGKPVENTELPGYVTVGMNDIKDVDQELAKISDDDIVKYLEANGTDVKTAMVANSIDDNELPSQEDYLLDEKTLDKYLNSIHINDLKN